ncbi:hypothetical protein OH491_03630 [Termitidicoccus mucosus]
MALPTQQLADLAGISTRAMRTRLVKLVDCGLVIIVGKNTRAPQRKYFWKKLTSSPEKTERENRAKRSRPGCCGDLHRRHRDFGVDFSGARRRTSYS